LQAPAQFSRVFWFLSHTCPLVQTKVLRLSTSIEGYETNCGVSSAFGARNTTI
jgi:hypothetical protein